MKFSHTAILAAISFVNAVPLGKREAEAQVVVTEFVYADSNPVTQVENVVVTVTAGQSPDSTPDAVVQATVIVDQNGNIIDDGSVATTTVEPSSSRHVHAAEAAVSSAASSDEAQADSDNDAFVSSFDNTYVTADSTSSAWDDTPTDEAEASSSDDGANWDDTPSTTSEAAVTTEAPTTTEAPSTTEAAATTTEAPAATTSSSSSSDLDDFASGVLNLHNELRAKHSADPLTWNSTLSDYAQSYLSNQNCVFAHSGGPYGENIALGYPTPEKAVDAWYDEYSSYDFSAGQFTEGTGHFTQMVWKETTDLGCYLYDCGSGRGGFLACEYYPAGNVIGYFIQNVS